MAVQISGNDITVPRDGTFSRNVSIAGTLTYEDVTNVDSIGLVTARNGIEVGASPGVAASISVDGNMIVSGISTFGGDVQVSDKIIHSGDTNTAIRFPDADTVSVETGGSEAARFDSNGNLLVGATSYQNGGFGGTSSGINVVGTQPQVLLHETDTDKDGYFGLAASILRIQTADSIPVTIWTNDTKRINVHETTGDTTLETGNLVIGTSGKGIDFSATSDLGGKTSELLDDYEEGTYTPILTGSSSNPTQSYAHQLGHYTKTGRVVQVSVDLQMAASGVSGGGGVVLLNLPFNQANLSGNQGVSASIGYAPSWGAITPTAAYSSPNDTVLYLLGNDKDTGANFVQASQVTNGTRLIIGFSYITET